MYPYNYVTCEVKYHNNVCDIIIVIHYKVPTGKFKF